MRLRRRDVRRLGDPPAEPRTPRPSDGRLDAYVPPRRRLAGRRTASSASRSPGGSGEGCGPRSRPVALAAVPRPDVVWTSGRELLLPHLAAFTGAVSRPLVVELDWTMSQQEQMAPWYFDRPPRTGRRWRRAIARQRAIFSRVALFTRCRDGRPMAFAPPACPMTGSAFSIPASISTGGRSRRASPSADERRPAALAVRRWRSRPQGRRPAARRRRRVPSPVGSIADVVTRDDVAPTVRRDRPPVRAELARRSSSCYASCRSVRDADSCGLLRPRRGRGDGVRAARHRRRRRRRSPTSSTRAVTGWRVAPHRDAFYAGAWPMPPASGRGCRRWGAGPPQGGRGRGSTGAANDRALVDAMLELVTSVAAGTDRARRMSTRLGRRRWPSLSSCSRTAPRWAGWSSTCSCSPSGSSRGAFATAVVCSPRPGDRSHFALELARRRARRCTLCPKGSVAGVGRPVHGPRRRVPAIIAAGSCTSTRPASTAETS